MNFQIRTHVILSLSIGAIAVLLGLGGCTKKVTQSLGGTLQVDLKSWDAVVPYGGPGTSQVFSISVAGGGILPVSVSTTNEWLGLDISSFETPAEVNVRTVLLHPSFPNDTLGIGEYDDTIVVTVQGAIGSPARIPVKLTVLPQMRVKPHHFYFLSALGAANPPAKSLVLENTGGGSVSYSMTSDASWLQVTPSTGTLPDTVDVSVNNSGLDPGLYTASIDIATVGTFTPVQSVVCTLVVASWLPQTTPLKQDIRGIDFIDAQNGCAVGVLISIQGNPPAVVKEGFSLVTTDGGNNWNLAMPLLPHAIGSINFSDGFTGWVVGGDGLVAKTTDGGFTWTTMDLGVSVDLFDVFFASADTGWIAGDSGTILRTTNGGADWNALAVRPTFKSLSSVHFINGTVGWVVGDVGTILSTTDGGLTWNAQVPPSGDDLRGVWIQSATNGWAVGKFGTIAHYDGIGWYKQLSPTVNELRDVQFASDQTGWAVGFHGEVLRTINGGVTWTKQALDVDESSLFFCVKFIDNLNGWVAGTTGLIFHTSNGGD